MKMMACTTFLKLELKTKFQKRFSDFTLYGNELILFSSPFSVRVHSVNEELQMEISEVQYQPEAKYHGAEIPEFYRYLGNGYPEYKHRCAEILSMFGSTYVCKQPFSAVKLKKT